MGALLASSGNITGVTDVYGSLQVVASVQPLPTLLYLWLPPVTYLNCSPATGCLIAWMAQRVSVMNWIGVDV